MQCSLFPFSCLLSRSASALLHLARTKLKLLFVFFLSRIFAHFEFSSRAHSHLLICNMTIAAVVRSLAADAVVLLLCISLKWIFFKFLAHFFFLVLFFCWIPILLPFSWLRLKLLVLVDCSNERELTAVHRGLCDIVWRRTACRYSCTASEHVCHFCPCDTRYRVKIINQCTKCVCVCGATVEILLGCRCRWHLFCYRFYGNFCRFRDIVSPRCKFYAVYVTRNLCFVLDALSMSASRFKCFDSNILFSLTHIYAMTDTVCHALLNKQFGRSWRVEGNKRFRISAETWPDGIF